MVRTLIQRRIRWHSRIVSVIACLLSVTHGAEWEVTFPALKDGVSCRSAAVAVEDGSMLVAVVLSGADATKPEVKSGGSVVPMRVVGHDPVSRLCFLKPAAPVDLGRTVWDTKVSSAPGVELQSMARRARTSGWIKQQGTKILPLALLRVNFDGPVPPPGSPLLTEQGHLAAVVFQQASGGNSAFALPVEAIHRVRKDILKSGDLVRGWLGLSLRAEISTPQVTRVVAGSPADRAGIRPNDVILQIGDRAVADYADSANAFFYLAPGDPVHMRLLRGADSLEVTVIPVVAPSKEGAAR